MNGVNCKRSKKEAAKYYRYKPGSVILTIRLAEKAGSTTVGNSWIWKEKYDPPSKE
jgi:hypothetical protein